MCQIHLSRRRDVLPRVTAVAEQLITSPPPVKIQLESPLFHSSKGTLTVIVMTPLTVQRLHLTHTGFQKAQRGIVRTATREVTGVVNMPLPATLLGPARRTFGSAWPLSLYIIISKVVASL